MIKYEKLNAKFDKGGCINRSLNFLDLPLNKLNKSFYGVCMTLSSNEIPYWIYSYKLNEGLLPLVNEGLIVFKIDESNVHIAPIKNGIYYDTTNNLTKYEITYIIVLK